MVSTHALYSFPIQTVFTKITRWVFSRADTILSLLQCSKTELVKLGIAENKIQPYTYWIDLQKFSFGNKTEAKSKLDWKSGSTHVLFIGRLIEKKGLLELISAAKLAQSVIFHIIGTGPLESEIKHQSATTPNLNFIGKIENKNLPTYYRAADVFIIPSTHEEGAGRVIMESLACGTPVIGSNRGGIPEILNQDVGEIIEVSPENIVNAINKLTKRVHDDKDLNYRCALYAQKYFSANNAEIIISSYNSGQGNYI